MASRFPELDALIARIEADAAQQLDVLGLSILAIKLAIKSNADAYLLIGALIEGLALALELRIPPDHRGDVAVETMRLLRDRMQARGVI